MSREGSVAGVDPELAARVAQLSPGGQRWLKTALQTIRISPLLDEKEARPDDVHERAAATSPPRAREPNAESAAEPQTRVEPVSSLEDVIEGRAKLDEQLETYPELAEELEGLGEIIDLLRGAGEARRKRGEQILREEILGETPEEDETESEGEG